MDLEWRDVDSVRARWIVGRRVRCGVSVGEVVGGCGFDSIGEGGGGGGGGGVLCRRTCVCPLLCVWPDSQRRRGRWRRHEDVWRGEGSWRVAGEEVGPAREKDARRESPHPLPTTRSTPPHTLHAGPRPAATGARTWCGPRRRKGVLLYRRKKAETDVLGWVPSERRCARTWPVKSVFGNAEKINAAQNRSRAVSRARSEAKGGGGEG